MAISQRIELLIEALRSREYKQARGVLGMGALKNRSPECFCVLGLACEVYRQETGKGQWVPDTRLRQLQRVKYYFRAEEGRPRLLFDLPEEVMDWYGLQHDYDIDGAPDLPVSTQADESAQTCASYYNDQGYDFEDLARFLENTYIRPEHQASQ